MRNKRRLLLCSIVFSCAVFFLFKTWFNGPHYKDSNYERIDLEINKFHDIVNFKSYHKRHLAPESLNPSKKEITRKLNSIHDTVSFGERRTRKLLNNNVNQLLRNLFKYDSTAFNFFQLKKTPFKDLVYRFHESIPQGKHLPGMPKKGNSAHWEKFWRGIHQTGLYDPSELEVDKLLRDLTLEPIIRVKRMPRGTQIKLVLHFKNGGSAAFKPMRFPREVETNPNHFYFSDYERHHSEIAAFHLDRLLGFYCVPPTIGRLVNLSSEIRNVGDSSVKKSFFYSPVKNLCFYSNCSYYCGTSHAVCGAPYMKEGSVQVFLPYRNIAERVKWRNPWRRSYSIRRKASWEYSDDFCERKVRNKFPYNSKRRLLQLIDMHIFDFLQGNMDRHHYDTFKAFGNDSFYLHFDNGRGFGKTKHDEMSILAPLYQCCLVSYETFMKLVKLYIGPESLSVLMRASLKKDSLNMILTEAHLKALDRRVLKVLYEIFKCVKAGKKISNVIVKRQWRI